ncbi:unnamed protein product [Camellia sinensis]
MLVMRHLRSYHKENALECVQRVIGKLGKVTSCLAAVTHGKDCGMKATRFLHGRFSNREQVLLKKYRASICIIAGMKEYPDVELVIGLEESPLDRDMDSILSAQDHMFVLLDLNGYSFGEK